MLEKLVCGQATGGDLINTSNALSNNAYGKRLAVMGTSVMQQQTTGSAFSSDGSISLALARLGWPMSFEPSDNFAVFGSTVQEIIDNQLPSVVASHEASPIHVICISAGGNDTRQPAIPKETTVSGIDQIIDTLKGLGINLVFELLNPFGKDADDANKDAKQKAFFINAHLKGRFYSGDIEIVDNTQILLDTTSIYGNAVQELTYDSNTSNLHPNRRGAFLLSEAWANKLTKYSSANIKTSINPVDTYNADNNPNGNVLTNTALSGSGSFPDSFSGGGSWSNVGYTLENGQAANAWELPLSSSLSAFLYDDYLGTGAWQPGDRLQPGDKIRLSIDVEVSSGVGIKNLEARLVENDGSTQSIVYGNVATSSDIDTPQFNGETLELKLRTPILEVRPYSGSGNVNIFTRLNILCDSVSSGAVVVKSWFVEKI